MAKRIKILLLVFFVCISHNGVAQGTTKCNEDIFLDSLLDKLTGKWNATGTVGSDTVVYSFTVDWILNHQFLELNFSDTAAKPAYTAKVLIGFDCENNQYIIHWLDNFGGAFSQTLGSGEKRLNSLEMTFVYPEGNLQNTFSYNAQLDQWTSTSLIHEENGNWTLFGTIVLKRGS